MFLKRVILMSIVVRAITRTDLSQELYNAILYHVTQQQLWSIQLANKYNDKSEKKCWDGMENAN